MKQNEPEKFVDIQTAADFLGVSTKTIRRYCSSQVRERIPFYRPFNALRFRLSEVAEWAERTCGRVERRCGRKLAVAKAKRILYNGPAPRRTEDARREVS